MVDEINFYLFVIYLLEEGGEILIAHKITS